jgi:hypothetical protein
MLKITFFFYIIEKKLDKPYILSIKMNILIQNKQSILSQGFTLKGSMNSKIIVSYFILGI